MSDQPNPPDWYPDPYGRHEVRYWDGALWTEHVASHGRQGTDDPDGAPPRSVEGTLAPDKVRHQVQEQAGIAPISGGGGCLFSEPVLVVNQKAKIIEVNSEYAIYDQDGTQLGAVRQVGQSKAKKAARAVLNIDQYLTHKLQVVDTAGNVALALTRPRKFVRSRVLVQDGSGNDLGQITQQNVFGKIRFALEADGEVVGSLNAQNWRAWNFTIADADGTEVANITKTWEGLAKTLFTTADNYVVHIHQPLDDPLRSLVVASSLTVDTALKQDSRGLS